MSEQAKSSKPRRRRLGELLIDSGIIDQKQLEEALACQKERGTKLGQTLIELGHLDEDLLITVLAKQLRMRFVSLRTHQPDPDVVRLLPEVEARRLRAIVLEDQGSHLLVGMADPMDVFCFDELSRLLKRRIRPAIVRESELFQLAEEIYRKTDEIRGLAGELSEDLGRSSFDLHELADESTGEDTPVVRLLESLFEDAVRARASDIHIEPDEDVLRIRLRVDGLLQEQVMDEARIAAALVLRLKLMASLDISEKRRPQDGRFEVKLANRSLDVRLSTLPTSHGEAVVMRLLAKDQTFSDLDHVGLPPALLPRVRNVIHHPHGLVLVTGPTGSGKTTTLYAALRELNTPERKIISIEDPVEYSLDRINQVQVHAKIGLTFASVLRTALRQDPDVLMVGEMRDTETMEIALRAALTGHLVLSTLHTNDAIGSALRLAEMGSDGWLSAAALRAVLAQRLVRTVCSECAESAPLPEHERLWVDAQQPGLASQGTFRRGRGCRACHDAGFRGRTGVYEWLEMTDELKVAMERGDNAAYTRAAHAQPGFRTLVQCALDRAAEGVTTISEVMRLAGDVESDA